MWDCIIIGGGLAGLIAGIRGAERGKSVLLISEGTGSFTYASGALDFGRVSDLLAKDNHPYRCLGEENILKAYQYLKTILPGYKGEWGNTLPVLTPLGEIRESDVLPEGLCASPLETAERIIVVEPLNLKDFVSQVYQENLQRILPQAEVTIRSLQIDDFAAWYQLGKMIPATDYAKYWRTQAGLNVLEKVFREIEKENADNKLTQSNMAVIFPSICRQFHETLQELLMQFPFQIVETSLMPPSPSGTLLHENLKRLFKNLGGEVMLGAKAVKATLHDGYCGEVFVKSKGKTKALKAKSYVLADGGILGGGIQVTPHQVREPIFDLPVYTPKEWTRENFLDHQPYAMTGIEVDTSLHPIDKNGETLVRNIYICGRMLAHWDPWSEGCGSGVSITSGYLVGERI